jgi:hypothetical protein
MKINHWLILTDTTGESFVEQLAKVPPETTPIHPATISKYAIHGAIPRPDVMRRIFIVTKGQVQPNDFYNLSIEETQKKRSSTHG